MIKFTLTQKGVGPNAPSVELECSTLPRIGDYVSHDKSGVAGTVQDIQFWWDDKGKFRSIEVFVR